MFKIVEFLDFPNFTNTLICPLEIIIGNVYPSRILAKVLLNGIMDNGEFKHLASAFHSFITRETSSEFYTKFSRCQLYISYDMFLKGLHLHSSIKRWVKPIPYPTEVLDVQSYVPK